MGSRSGSASSCPFESGLNQWVDLGVNFRYFFARKTMFVKYSQGFAVLPGGLGTLDEMFEALTLAQTRKVTSFPVALLGKAYWQGLFDWLSGPVADDGKISARDLDMVTLTDDVDEAVEIMLGSHWLTTDADAQRPE